MTNRDDELAVLSRGLDQAAGVLDSVTDDDLETATPCHDWSVAALVDHLVQAPAKFAGMVRGEEVDWAAPTPHVGDDRAEVFRSASESLLGAWADAADTKVPMGPDWQSAEIAVHTYDLATALGRPTKDFDPEVASRGLAFMRANLTDDNREPAFEAEQKAPDGADAYQEIAAFAGRMVARS
jgi:uncharacterized protein (TIGR03086 family)